MLWCKPFCVIYKVWFKNRRAKFRKRNKAAALVPPLADAISPSLSLSQNVQRDDDHDHSRQIDVGQTKPFQETNDVTDKSSLNSLKVESPKDNGKFDLKGYFSTS